MKTSIFALVVAATLWHNSAAFSLLRPSSTISSSNYRRRVSIRLETLIKSSKEDEIASLEEKLRKLKEEAQKESEETKLDESDDTPPVAEIEEPFEEMLSESWKVGEQKEEEGGGSVVKNVIGAGVLLLALIAFSQVPVGNEGLDKYSTAKPNQSIDLGDLNPSKPIY